LLLMLFSHSSLFFLRSTFVVRLSHLCLCRSSFFALRSSFLVLRSSFFVLCS
jgi:hypothetical protein